MIYLYSFVEPPVALDSALGLGGGRLSCVPLGRAAVVTSPVTERPRPVAAALWAHQAVVELIQASGPVAPVRFGTVFPSEDVAQACLRPLEAAIVGVLARARDRREMAVRAVLKGGPDGAEDCAVTEVGPLPDGPGQGRAYLRQLYQTIGPSRSLAPELSMVHGELSTVAVAAQCRPQGRRSTAASFLVAAESLATFKEEVARVARRHPAVRLDLTGPWPPYSFVDFGELAVLSRREAVQPRA